ncbi:phage tail protein [Litorilituus sediminis]|uniref:Phage tail protein n=1 Tax=Litorilituus sediminis TaxID=718192 RepID=A0A4P6P6P3_9GAMM|nr:tail fiber protein [Litorilituus sediminis]QBG37193.1 phage tail protein [Litorilituus sediminis]
MKTLLISVLSIFVALIISKPVQATTDALSPMLGEMKWVAFNFAPRGWAKCEGQLLAVSQNSALFSLLGTIYGGDGRTTFALPDMRGRIMVHAGNGPGLTPRRLGEKSGEESHTLSTATMPNHSHTVMATSNAANSTAPDSAVVASQRRSKYFTTNTSNVNMDSTAISNTGGSQPHNNMAPTNTLTCIIALQGVYPSRN